MYLAYVKNTKFTSPSTLQSISFMRRSLVELLGLDHSLAYYHAFVYIRQLAIHLRNAITCSEKKDSLLAVYNWQFVHSLELWGALVGHPGSREAMAPLVYPLVQVCELIIASLYTHALLYKLLSGGTWSLQTCPNSQILSSSFPLCQDPQGDLGLHCHLHPHPPHLLGGLE